MTSATVVEAAVKANDRRPSAAFEHQHRLRPAESLKAYEEAVKLQRRKVALAAVRGGVSVAGVAEVIQTRVPAKLLNNAAVLYMRAGRPEKALELLEEALQVYSRSA